MTGHDDPERTEVVDGVPFPSRLPAPETLLGTVLADRFECRSILGQGSTGTVYRAIQQPLGRPVAVKICWIRDDYTGDRVARFLSEASLAGGLQHPNVVTVHDFGRTDDGACYMVMELLEGASLRSQMDGQPMRIGRFLALFDQILSGLRHAHRSGLVHRDMKPGNIQVMKSDEGTECAKILDFGLVQRDGEGVPEGEKGTFVGTPHYASPEQVRGQAAGPRSDLYAVGIMMYRALTGCLPFEGPSAMAIASAQVNAPYPPMRSRAPSVNVDPDLEAIVRRAMDKDAERRFSNADAMRKAIREWAREHGMTITAQYVDSEPESMELHAMPAPNKRWPMVTLALVSLMAIWTSWWVRPLQTVQVSPDKGAGDSRFWNPGANQVDNSEVPVPLSQVANEPDASKVESGMETELLEVLVQINSRPSGAQVTFGGENLGVTPFEQLLDIRRGPSAAERRFHLTLKGHKPEVLSMDLTKGSAVGHVQLEALTRNRSTQRIASASKNTPAPKVSQWVEGIEFTDKQALDTVSRANQWGLDNMQALGIRTQQINAVIQGRPYLNLTDLSQALGVGPKTLKALRDAEQ